MKTVLLSLSAIAMIAFVSCKKQYTCQCKHEIYENHSLPNTTTELKYIDARSENKAEKSCVSHNSESIDENGYGHRTLCNIK